jgi:hypothetical protein
MFIYFDGAEWFFVRLDSGSVVYPQDAAAHVRLFEREPGSDPHKKKQYSRRCGIMILLAVTIAALLFGLEGMEFALPACW